MKSIKIGNKTFTGVEKISCKCAVEEGVQRKFIDQDDAATASVEELSEGNYQLNITGGVIEHG